MSISQKPFRSDTGFEAPGFLVDDSGNINIAGELRYNGTPFISSGTLSSDVVSSSLTSVGTLTALTVNGTTVITSTGLGSINNVVIGNATPRPATFTDLTVTGALNVSGQDFLTSQPATTKTIDNYNIGTLVRGSGNFTTLTATTNVVLAPTTTGSINNVAIGSTVPATGKFTNITLTQEATASNQVITKNYVDSRISAYAIALGS